MAVFEFEKIILNTVTGERSAIVDERDIEHLLEMDYSDVPAEAIRILDESKFTNDEWVQAMESAAENANYHEFYNLIEGFRKNLQSERVSDEFELIALKALAASMMKIL